MKIHILTDKKLEEIIQKRVETSVAEHAADLKTEIVRKQLVLSSLQSQINPHFLYNALECVRGQAILDHAPKISEMAQALSNYFRYSVSLKNDIVSIKDELENVKNYLKIQLFRFSNRFNVEIEYESEDLLDASIPKLTLQPVVENAIIHGFEKLVGNATIKIEILAAEKNIYIIVSDNGSGMDKATLSHLNEKIRNFEFVADSNKRSTGVAIPNVDKRLKLLFGNEYGLHVSSIKDVGTDVEIHIPYLHKAVHIPYEK